jgi:ABC-type multidrug transport system fused ATPase/permease subunit
MAFHILDTQPTIQEVPDAVALHEGAGRVTFEDVSFSYPERSDTLRRISFDAAPGQVIAIVGPTGAGKTTLASLIPRFYDPLSGRILVDGRDIRGLTLKSLRDHISIVPQEPLLFSGTIADNIRYGRLDATMDDLVAAATAANAHDFITGLADGYETQIGERGVRLSGGERQRLCIARAFLKNASILILDEPTASIDSRTEAVILDALDRLMLGRTTFMIAHRLSTVRHADLILALDRGAIVERGSHEELLHHGGLYAQLYDVQVRRRERRRSALVSPASGERA